MKAVILAGGLGTRMGDETIARPKPLVEVGGQPIVWHILKIYEAHGITDFVVCAGYAGQMVAEYFEEFRSAQSADWRVQVIDTGESTATGGRLRLARRAIGEDTFCMTYGDGVSDIDISRLVAFHRDQGKLVTLTAVHPRLPFGVVTFSRNGHHTVGFQEKPIQTDLWINSGFFVIEPAALEYIHEDEPWERGPLTRLAEAGQLTAYTHEGFWQCMDTPQDRQMLEQLWRGGDAPWKVW
jgi:glucose-1-phosphate cytidylyltransferase